jgi:hypothetical protein
VLIHVVGGCVVATVIHWSFVRICNTSYKNKKQKAANKLNIHKGKYKRYPKV